MSTAGQAAIRTQDLVQVYRLKPSRKERRETRRAGRQALVPEELVALDRANVEVRRGEIFGILGPNGASKTTLIKILTTLLAPTAGRAWVDGLDAETEAADIRHRINMVAGGETSGYGLLTVREKLWMFSQFYGIDFQTTNQRIDDLLQLVDMADRKNTKISDLSTGLRQKRNFVRGFITDPDIIFLDEPTVGLDVSASRRVRDYVKNWVAKNPAKTILLTTHYMAEADELCDRGAIIDQGKILARDTPFNLKHTLQKDVVFRLRVAPLPEQSPGAGGLADRVSALEGVCNCIQRQFDDHTELRLILKAEDVLTSVIGTLNNHGARLLSQKADADAGGCICRSRRSRTRARHQPRGRTACVSGAVHPQYQRKEKT